MPKAKTIIIALILISQSCLSQVKLLIDELNYKDSVTLIATSSKFKEYEFSVERMTDVLTEIKKLNYSSPIESSEGANPVVLKLVVKGKIIDRWIVNPLSSSIKVDGKFYSFDNNQLKYLSQKYPVRYNVEERNFNSHSELEIYYNQLLQDKNFLYIVWPDFENQFQGSFTLTFKKKSFPTVSEIFDFVKPLMNEIVPNEKYSLSYDPFGENENSEEHAIKVDTKDIKLYKEFNNKNAFKGEWIPSPYRSYIIRRT